MDPSNLSPYVRLAWDSTIYGPFYLERIIFDYELLYIKDGQMEVRIEDTVYVGSPGDIFLFKPGQAHSVKVEASQFLHQPHLHFDLFYQPDSPNVKVGLKIREQLNEHELATIRPDSCSEPPFDLPNHFRPQKPQLIENMIFDIIHEYERKIPFSEFALKGLFIRLWTQLLRDVYWSNHAQLLTNWEQLMRVKNYLDANNESVSLDVLADMVNLDKYYLIKIYRKAFGTSPIRYHLERRVEKAKEQIQFTTLSINEIAELFGFQSLQAFSRAFRGVEGVPPSYYRKGEF